MNEDELKAKEEELNTKQEELTKRENELNARQEEFNEHKEDAAAIVKQVKDEYETKILKQHDKYEARLKERENVIKQLLSGNGGDANKQHENIIIDKINARRIAQNKKW